MDWFFFLHQKIKELDPLSSMATQPTHLFNQGTVLPFLLTKIEFTRLTFCPDLCAIIPNSCDISSSKTVVLWLLYIIFILLFGSGSLVSPESALTWAEWRISSLHLGNSHTLQDIDTGETLYKLQLIPSQSSVQHYEILIHDRRLSNPDYML